MKNSLDIDDLCSILSESACTKYTELRYHSRTTNEINFNNGELESIRNIVNSGCSVRVLVHGSWGFSSTNDLSDESLKDCLSEAISVARSLSDKKKNKIRGLATSKMAKGIFKSKVNIDLASVDIEHKLKIAREAEEKARMYSTAIKSASCLYREILDHKMVVNSDGAEVQIYDSKPEFNVTSVAKDGSNIVSTSEGIGTTGGWEDLFSERDHLEYAYLASEKAIKMLEARHISGEKTTVILDPGMVGMICHEAVGHMVEADFVLSGSAVNGKIGEKIANELITLIDSGQPSSVVSKKNPAGSIPVDDEGVKCSSTFIIEKGVLKSFLHNRESAFLFDANPTGNARAFEYNDEPLIRMTNTYIQPGRDRLDDMIKETKQGYFIKGPRNGQADANGEFMFGFQEVYSIKQGEIKEMKRGASISGSTFDVLDSIDMVGNDFDYDMGTGYCGKFQLAKVDGGGPHIRCTAMIGGLQ